MSLNGIYNTLCLVASLMKYCLASLGHQHQKCFHKITAVICLFFWGNDKWMVGGVMQQRNFLCPKLGLGGGAGAVWEELDNERERWQDPHSCNALEINALSIGPLCISTSVYSYCSKNISMKMTPSSFLPLTPFF